MALPISSSKPGAQGYAQRFMVKGPHVLNDVFGKEFTGSEYSKYAYSFGFDKDRTFALLSLVKPLAQGARIRFHCVERKKDGKDFLVNDIEILAAPLAAKAKKPMKSNPRYAPSPTKVSHINIYGEEVVDPSFSQSFSLHLNNEHMEKFLGLLETHVADGFSMMIDVNEHASKYEPGTTYLSASIRFRERMVKETPTVDAVAEKIKAIEASGLN